MIATTAKITSAASPNSVSPVPLCTAHLPQMFRTRLSATAVEMTVFAIERWPINASLSSKEGKSQEA